eukprot:921316-Prymnesium_polylepis.1
MIKPRNFTSPFSAAAGAQRTATGRAAHAGAYSGPLATRSDVRTVISVNRHQQAPLLITHDTSAARHLVPTEPTSKLDRREATPTASYSSTAT